MGIFDAVDRLFGGPFTYRDKNGKTWWLHEKDAVSGTKLYYFSGVAENAVGMPAGYTLVESSKTGLPLLKKIGQGGGG